MQESDNLLLQRLVDLPMDLDIARTPKTRCPFHGMTLPPEASILAYSSSLFGW